MLCFIPDWYCNLMIPPIMSLMKAVIFAVVNTQQAANLSWEKYCGLKEVMLYILQLANVLSLNKLLLLIDYDNLVFWI